MKIKHVLSTKVVAPSLIGTTKEEIIRELLDLLVQAGLVSEPDIVYKDLMNRERKMSTGIQHGVAIPHAKTVAVSELVAAIGVKREGVDFNSFDGEPSTIFIMTLSPVDRVGPHVQFLAEISMIIKHQSARKKILEATTAQEILDVFGV
ncbi:MAG: PTS sugar transporter subunit IIA [Sphaerochaetaceae bacterium]|jgi:mannitol/fructose-specific phosphotransferase system IIA component (Ntr-type)